MRATTFTIAVVCFLSMPSLLAQAQSLNPCAKSPDGKHTFKQLIDRVRLAPEGGPNKLQRVFVAALGLGDRDVEVHRFGVRDDNANNYRAIDLLSENDIVFFYREPDLIFLWRLRPTGEIISTAHGVRGGSTMQRLSNLEYAPKIRALCEFFYDVWWERSK